MKEALIFDSISYTKMEPLTGNEVQLMKNKVIKQLKIYVPGYLLLTAIAIWILAEGPPVLNTGRRYPRITIDENTTTLFWTVAPYFSLFLFLLTTTFLALYYFRSVHPMIKDVKGGKKITVFYRPKKTAMALFNRYYITIPLYSNQQIEVSKVDFDGIKEEELLSLEMGPSSNFILNLKNKEEFIHVDDLTL
jgi:hypothetical protein